MPNVTQGPLTIQTELTQSTINLQLRRIRDELDTLIGLRGPIKTYDSTQYVDTNNQLLHGWGDSGLTS